MVDSYLAEFRAKRKVQQDRAVDRGQQHAHPMAFSSASLFLSAKQCNEPCQPHMIGRHSAMFLSFQTLLDRQTLHHQIILTSSRPHYARGLCVDLLTISAPLTEFIVAICETVDFRLSTHHDPDGHLDVLANHSFDWLRHFLMVRDGLSRFGGQMSQGSRRRLGYLVASLSRIYTDLQPYYRRERSLPSTHRPTHLFSCLQHLSRENPYP